MPIKSFRGLIADGVIDTISLHTNTGSTGYRIKKLQIITNTPGAGSDYESCLKIYKIKQSTADAVVDFSDNTLLGVAYVSGDSASVTAVQETIIFDNEVFNQDIYITHSELSASQACNYYIELEQIKLDLAENTTATLKDIRNIEAQ
tara:strand:+ start:1724 stop:2164 length:441 start_codon:yes stop_codon:yes gene_type:complete